MRIGLMQKDKAEKVFIAIRNAESSADMLVGQPTSFDMSGTSDGNDAVLPATEGATAAAFASGIVGSIDPLSGTNAGSLGIPNGGYGLAQVFGFSNRTLVARMTRAASTDSFNSFTAIAVGDIMQYVTNVNFISRSGANSNSAALFAIVACESAASGASSASATSDTRLTITTALKTFLRLM